MANGRLPDWEVPNMLAKYYINDTKLDRMAAYLKLIEFLKVHNIEVIDYSNFIGDDPQIYYFKLDPHWNNAGHKWAAGVIYQRLYDDQALSAP